MSKGVPVTMNDSAMDMTEVCNTVDSTKRDLLSMQEKHEAIFQENYKLKKKIERMERIAIDLESELTYVNNERTKEKSKLLSLRSELDSANARIKELESLVEEDRLQLQTLLTDVDERKAKEPESKALIGLDYEQLNALTGEIQSLELQREEDQGSIKLLLDVKATNEYTINRFKQENQMLQDELIEIKEHLQQKTEDLANVNQSLKSTREEKFLLNTEVQVLKASDSNAARGNSLFAEVEENRQKVTAQREVLKLKYLNLKKVLSQKQVENNKLKLEIVKIRREEKEDEKSIHTDYCDLLGSYKERISELEQRLGILDQHAYEAPIVISDGDTSQLQWVNTVVENSRKEARTLREELERRSSNYVTQGHQLFDSQKENRKLKATTLQMQSEIDELRLHLDTIKAANENVDDGISPPATDIAIAYQREKIVRFKEAVHKYSNNSSDNSSNNTSTSAPEDKDSDKENMSLSTNKDNDKENVNMTLNGSKDK